MKDNLTLFEVKVWFGDYIDDELQRRYVVAKTEEEAEEKIKAYARILKRNGCAELHYLPNFKVEIDYVID